MRRRKGSQPDGRYVGSAEVRKIFNVCDMTIRRWQADPAINFPAPVKLGQGRVSRNYWWLPALEEWRAGRARGKAGRAAVSPPTGEAAAA